MSGQPAISGLGLHLVWARSTAALQFVPGAALRTGSLPERGDSRRVRGFGGFTGLTEIGECSRLDRRFGYAGGRESFA